MIKKKNSIDLKNGTTPLKGIIDVFQLNLMKLYLHSNSQRITKKKLCSSNYTQTIS